MQMKGRIFAVIADGFEELELIAVADIMKRLGFEFVLASLRDDLKVVGAHQIKMECDAALKELNIDDFDGIFLPGGMPGSLSLYESEELRGIIQKMNEDEKLVSAICAAPMVLAKAGVLKNREFTMYPGMDQYLNGEKYSSQLVVKSENIVTGKGPGAAVKLGLCIGEYFGLTEEVSALKKAMFID